MASGTMRKQPEVTEQALTLVFSNGTAVSNLGGDSHVIGAYSLQGAYVIQPYYQNSDNKWHFFAFYFTSTSAVKTVADGNFAFVVQMLN